MHRSTTPRLAAATLAAVISGCASPAHPEAANACADAPAELQHQLASNGATDRLDALRGFIETAVDDSGHAPREHVTTLFTDPLVLTRASTARPSLLPETIPLERSGTTPLQAILERLDRIHAQLDTAFGEITDEQARDLRRLLPALLGGTANGSDLEALEHGAALVEVHARIDFDALESAADLLAGLARPEPAQALAEQFRDRPAGDAPDWLGRRTTDGIVHAERTRHGAVIVGGPGDNVYSGPTAVIVDLGGNDTYAQPPGDRVRMVIDIAGDDNYAPSAGAILGASLLVDHAGDDTWSGDKITQGAAAAGIGMLVDHAGNDRYFAGELAQGAALAGIGVLVDHAGDDLYAAARFAQGFGGALGTGVVSDRGGNDIYLAGNRHPSSYDVVGNYQAFSQGVGMGFRNDIAGGIGLLHDHEGDDAYTAGNFGQGTGYYLGAGVLLDEQGDDTYTGTRYTQGTSAHMGIGLLRDEHGDDDYSGSPSASQGAAWDLALAALVDCAGNDSYQVNEFGLGAAAQNAIAFFLDAAGNDEYQANRNSKGHTGPTDYHDDGDGIGNVAAFIAGKFPSSSAPRADTHDASTPNIPSATPGRATQSREPADAGPHPVVSKTSRKAQRYPGPREFARQRANAVGRGCVPGGKKHN